MMRVWRSGVSTGAVLLLAVAGAAPAAAHPHVWIDARYDLKVGTDRLVRAVAVEWTFDEVYSQASQEIIDTNQDHTVSPEELDELIDGAIRRLKDWHYYLDLRQDSGGKERRIGVGTVTDRKATLEKGQIVFRFTVPLATPVALEGGRLRLRGYDPTLFIGVDPVERHPLTLSPPQPGCLAETGLPQEPPSRPLMGGPTLVPDKNVPKDIKPGTEGIGFAFARVITLTCGPGAAAQ